MRVLFLALMLGLAASHAWAGPAGPLQTLNWSAADRAALLGVLGHAADEGLDPKDYRPASQDQDALDRAALAYLSDLRHGRPALERLDDDVELPLSHEDDAALLAGALKTNRLVAFLAEAAPPDPQYAKLREALAFYRAIAERGGWPQLPTHLSLEGADANLLRDRLHFEDAALASPDANLTDALKRFQERHGLVADGRLGRASLAALNVTAEARVQQIAANMERWRWLPRVLEPDRIAVNVPGASLELVLNGREMLRSRVVVGRPRSPTPILRAENAGITINPPWNVPDSIARKEILPKLKADPAYLQSHDMILLNGPAGDPHGLHVNWQKIPAGTFPFRLQQHPGRQNALGTIKLELPNRFDVYLHDTPAKRAFANPERDISHGCVRVERILPLAAYLLSENLDAMTAISDAVATGDTEYLPLKRQLPVYFLYWTAFAATDGTIQFRPDIYGRDRRLIAALDRAPQWIGANSVSCSRG